MKNPFDIKAGFDGLEPIKDKAKGFVPEIKPFALMTDVEKNKHVNAGNGRMLTQEESDWKTRNWDIMKAIKNKQMPANTFGQLAYNYFK